MNPAIGASALLGLGNKSASAAFEEFGVTLGKIYETQQEQLNEESASRNEINKEYNKEQRARKKRESDLVEILSGLNGDDKKTKSGAKKKSQGSIFSKLLLGAGAVVVGKVLYDTVSDRITTGVTEGLNDITQSISDILDDLTKPFQGLVGGGEEQNSQQSQNTSTSSSSSSSSGKYTGRAANTFTLIGSGEGSYNSVNRGTAGDSPGGAKSVVGKNLTDMTIGELVQAQQSGQLFAVGKYQIIPKTMPGFLETMGIKDTDKFDQATQEKFPQYVLDHKRPTVGNYLSGKSNDRKGAIQALAREFAAVGLAYPEAGRRRGQSRYAGKSGNAASITPEEMGKALDRDRQKLQKGGKVEKKLKKSKRKGNGPPSEAMMNQGLLEPQKKQRGGKIVLHWAGSPHNGSASSDYHATIMKDGSVKKTGDYNVFNKAHAPGFNSTSVGISLDAMGKFDGRWPDHGNYGPYAVKPEQYEGMAKLTAQILKSWGKDVNYVTANNVLTHAEAANIGDSKGPYGPTAPPGTVPPNDYRWDLWSLYENDPRGSGGPKIRNMIKKYMTNGDFELESEEASDFVGPSNSSGTPGMTGISTNSPSLPPMPQTLEGMVDQLLAPIFGLFGAFGAMIGNPLSSGTQGEMQQQQQQSDVGSTPFTGSVSERARMMHDYIVEKGYSTDQAKGIVANIQRESTFRTDISGDDGTSFGLFQWHADRGTRMKAAVENWSTNWKGQIDYALQEHVGPQYKDATAGMSAKDAAYWWMYNWEIPADRERGGNNHMKMNGFIDAYKFQRGGMVGQQINTGGMRGIQSPHMSKLREAQNRMRRKGPRVIRVALPPIPTAKQEPVIRGASKGMEMPMTMSQLGDFNRRLAMGALV